MPIKLKRAGSAVAQPLPSRSGGPIEGGSPLQLFLDKLPQMRLAMRACGVESFAFSVLNAAPKIALSKWTVDEFRGTLRLCSEDSTQRLIPLGDRESYWHALAAITEAGNPIGLVPEWAAQALKARGFKVERQQTEYLIRNDTWGHLPSKSMRRNVRDARLVVEPVELDQNTKADFLACNKAWYRENAETKFRTYDKTSIDWLIEHWWDLHSYGCRTIGMRHDGQLIAFAMACPLTDNSWSLYTERFTRTGPVKAANTLCSMQLATMFSGLEWDGTADTTTIREIKEKLAHAKVNLYRVTP